MASVATVDAKGCPDLAALESVPIPAAVMEHVKRCDMCRLVVEVIAVRRTAPSDDCDPFFPLIAARGDGVRLNAAARIYVERHLASCPDCRALAETEAPLDDEPDHTALPTVDPAGYQLGNEVDRGGMGRILEARDLRVGRDVAVKELLEKSPQLAARFEREARLTARLQHPGIVPIYEIGKWSDGTPFYTMRMVEGRTLLAAISAATTFRERLALLSSVIDACEAVAFAHSKRVIHRDLKPGNILVGDYGETVVIDWGLAKDLASSEPEPEPDRDSGASDRLTSAGAVLGTLSYMPPEQAAGNLELVDERADVYALGAILYHLLAGASPYADKSGAELREAVRTGAARPIEEAAPNVPRDLASIVRRAMASAPDKRHRNAGELARELTDFQAGRVVESHVYSPGERIWRFVDRNRAAVTIGALAVIFLIGVAVVSLRNIYRSRDEARATARALLLEEGRAELMAGDHLRALAYLHEAEAQGFPADNPTFSLLLGQALTHLAAREKQLDCGTDDRLIDVSVDGSMIAAACYDRARVWTVVDGDIRQVLALPTKGTREGAFHNVKLSHDRKLIATWGSAGGFSVWDIATGTERRFAAKDGSRAEVNATVFTADDTRIATFDEAGYARVFDVASGRELVAIFANQHQVRRLRRLHGALDHTETKLLTVSFTGQGRGFSIDDGKDVGTFEFGGFLAGGSISQDGSRAAGCRMDGVVKVVGDDGTPLYEIAGNTDVVWKCVFSPDGNRVLTGSHDGTAKVWDISGRRPAGRPGNGRLVTSVDVGDLVWSVRFSPDGQRFVTMTPGKHMKVWDAASGALLGTYDSRGKDAWFLPDNRLVAARGDGQIDVWRTSSRMVSYSPPTGTSVVAVTKDAGAIVVDRGSGDFATEGPTGVAVLRPDRSQQLATVTYPIAVARHHVAGALEDLRGIVVIDTSGKTVATLPIELGSEHPLLELSDDGSHLVAAWADRAEIWDVAGRRVQLRLPGANRVLLSGTGARAIAWREPDEREREARVQPGRPVVWDVATGTSFVTLPTVDARPIGFAAGDRRVLVIESVSSSAPEVSLWDIATSVPIMRQAGVAIAPSVDSGGRWITTIGQDREVTVWDATDGSKQRSFAGQQLQVAQANETGSLLVAIGDYGRAVMILNATDGRVLARHALRHKQAEVRPTSFLIPQATAWWTGSGAIASQSLDVAVWRTTNPYSATEIATLIRKHVPYAVDNGQLVLKKNHAIVGRVVRGGDVVRGAAIALSMRRPADATATEMSWDTMKARHADKPTHSDDNGEFRIEGLTAGDNDYRLRVTIGSDVVVCPDVVVGIDPEPMEIDLATGTCD